MVNAAVDLEQHPGGGAPIQQSPDFDDQIVVVERGFGALARSNVAQNADVDRAAIELHLVDRQFNRQYRAVLVHAGQFDIAFAHYMRLAAVDVTAHAGGMLAAQILRYQHCDILPDRLVRAITEDPGRRNIERFDRSLGIDRDNAVTHTFKYGANAQFLFIGCALLCAQLGIHVDQFERLRLQCDPLPGNLDKHQDLGDQNLGNDRRQHEVDCAPFVSFQA